MLNNLRQKLQKAETMPTMVGAASLIIILNCISIFSTELPVPSFPAIADSFGATATAVQLSVTLFLLGMGISQIFYGPFSDHYGRRPVLLVGLLLHLLGAVFCVYAETIEWFLFGRLFSGIGASSAICLTRSIARDIFSGVRLAKVTGYLSLMLSAVPLIVPIIGGYIQDSFGWQGNFIVLTLLSVAVLIIMFVVLPETRPVTTAQRGLESVIKNYLKLLTNSAFISHAICSSIAFSGILVYFQMSTFLLQNILGLSAVAFGWLTLLVMLATIIGRYINILLLNKIEVSQIIAYGNGLMASSGFVMLLFGIFGATNIVVIVLPMIFFVIGSGLVFSNAITSALMPFPQIAGLTSALFGSIQMLGTFIITAIAAHTPQSNQISLALILTLLGVIGWMVYSIGTSRNRT